jgi:hypothetical protein
MPVFAGKQNSSNSDHRVMSGTCKRYRDDSKSSRPTAARISTPKIQKKRASDVATLSQIVFT